MQLQKFGVVKVIHDVHLPAKELPINGCTLDELGRPVLSSALLDTTMHDAKVAPGR